MRKKSKAVHVFEIFIQHHEPVISPNVANEVQFCFVPIDDCKGQCKAYDVCTNLLKDEEPTLVDEDLKYIEMKYPEYLI